MSVGFPGPLRSDHGEDHVALADCLVDVFPEVDAEGMLSMSMKTASFRSEHEDGRRSVRKRLPNPAADRRGKSWPSNARTMGATSSLACTSPLSKIASSDTANNTDAF